MMLCVYTLFVDIIGIYKEYKMLKSVRCFKNGILRTIYNIIKSKPIYRKNVSFCNIVQILGPHKKYMLTPRLIKKCWWNSDDYNVFLNYAAIQKMSLKFN